VSLSAADHSGELMSRRLHVTSLRWTFDVSNRPAIMLTMSRRAPPRSVIAPRTGAMNGE
jgi:hypothetical protein